jgi:hypothetical protein
MTPLFLNHGRLRAAVVLLAIGTARADQTVTTEYNMGGTKQTMKTLTKDNMTRTEPDAKHAMILRPDSVIVLDLDKKSYTRTATDTAAPAVAPVVTKGGIIKTRVEVTDTGETKQAFGKTARHLIVKMTSTSGPGTCHPLDLRVETDGWYLETPPAESKVSKDATQDCVDEQQVETIGTAKAGFPVEYTSKTWTDGNGPVNSSMKLLTYNTDTLDASLFDIPAGFTDGHATKAVVGKDASKLVGVAAGPGDLHSRAAAILNSESVYATPMTDDSIETARQNHCAYILVLDQGDAAPKKASKFGKLTKAVTGEKADLHYKLINVEDGSTVTESSVTGKSGNGLQTAMTLAQVAAPLAMMMTGPGMLQSMFSNQSALQSLLGANPALGGMSGMDPNLSSMARMSQLLSPGSAGVSTLVAGTPANANAAADAALHQIAKAVAAQIAPTK